MNKIIKSNLILIILLVLGYHSVFFKKLSTIAENRSPTFDFNSLADSLYYNGILTNTSPAELATLLDAVTADADAAFLSYGNRLGIGNSAYFLIKLSGQVIDLSEHGIQLRTKDNLTVFIDTKFIFGNAIRDASGLVKLTDFKTNADFNKLSEALNTIVREIAIPKDLTGIQSGDQINVIGALKLHKTQPKPEVWSILPIKIIEV